MPDQGLNQPGVLVTRPAQQADKLSQLIEQAGFRVHRLPLIEIAQPLDENAARQGLATLDAVDIVIFISANAVRQCYLYIGKALPQNIRVACVGQATARQFQDQFGRAADLVPQSGYNSEALLALPELQAVSDKKILIIKGEGGRDLLARTLADRGAEVSYANLYRRIIPTEASQQLSDLSRQDEVDVLILTSGEAIENLVSLSDSHSQKFLSQKTWLVIHPRLAEIVKQQACYKDILISDGPGDEQILQCLIQWAGQ
ncbi:MAG: uroporphyrinogen-III synthase [Gammaproteobacteria bacterium]|nr:uroporphyrinogen-III synthase [Gammaproteobacteria bacterium]